MEILKENGQPKAKHTSENRGIFPWQLRLFLATFFASGNISAVEIAQRFSASTPTVEAHEIDCFGGVNVNDARPGTVVSMVDQKTGKVVVNLTISQERKGSARWPAGQRSNGETSTQPNQHFLAVLARVPGLTDTPKEIPCDGSTWNIRVPETIGISGTPAVVSTPEKSPTPPTITTPRVETSPTTGTVPAVSPAQPFNLSQAIKDLANNVSAYASGIGDISKAWAPQTEKEAALKDVASLKSKIEELEKDGKTSKEELAKAKEVLENAQKESEDKSKVGLVGLGVGILGLAGAGFMWFRNRRRPEEPATPAPAEEDGSADGGAEPAAPAISADGGPADDEQVAGAH